MRLASSGGGGVRWVRLALLYVGVHRVRLVLLYVCSWVRVRWVLGVRRAGPREWLFTGIGLYM